MIMGMLRFMKLNKNLKMPYFIQLFIISSSSPSSAEIISAMHNKNSHRSLSIPSAYIVSFKDYQDKFLKT